MIDKYKSKADQHEYLIGSLTSQFDQMAGKVADLEEVVRGLQEQSSNEKLFSSVGSRKQLYNFSLGGLGLVGPFVSGSKTPPIVETRRLGTETKHSSSLWDALTHVFAGVFLATAALGVLVALYGRVYFLIAPSVLAAIGSSLLWMVNRSSEQERSPN